MLVDPGEKGVEYVLLLSFKLHDCASTRVQVLISEIISENEDRRQIDHQMVNLALYSEILERLIEDQGVTFPITSTEK
jgi:hypothetical protein